MAQEQSNESRRRETRELYYITHVANLSSIASHGILSHNLIEKKGIDYTPIYDKQIVANREGKKTPDGQSLWDFANLYFQPRNPMMYRVVIENSLDKIAVVSVRRDVLTDKATFFTDGNAASADSKFYPIDQFKKHEQRILKETSKDWWNIFDGSKRKIMAECLVPNVILPDYIHTIYVATAEITERLRDELYRHGLYIVSQPSIFFAPERQTVLTQFLSVMDGDMFFSRMQTLTVSVNCVGVMGKGLASRAKFQFPDVYVDYQKSCRSGKLKLGKPYIYKRESSFDEELADEPKSLTKANARTWFILFPTKNHWREGADIKAIEEGLKWVRDNYRGIGITSLAVPALGCGLGGLDWKDVGPMLCKYLSLDIPVQVYLPAERRIPDEQITKEFLMQGKL